MDLGEYVVSVDYDKAVIYPEAFWQEFLEQTTVTETSTIFIVKTLKKKNTKPSILFLETFFAGIALLFVVTRFSRFGKVKEQ